MDAPGALDKLMARGALAALRERAAALRAVQASLEAVLPAGMRGEVTVTGWAGGVLRVAATDAAIATRLRLHAPALCAALRGRGGALAEIHSLRCRLAPGSAGGGARAGTRAPSKAPARSVAGAQVLARAAQEVRDPDLAGALARLAQHLRGGD